MVQGNLGEAARPAVERNPFFWGGPGYTLTALLMAVSAVAFGWQFLRTPSPATSQNDGHPDQVMNKPRAG